jgi:hypothetical protein
VQLTLSDRAVLDPARALVEMPDKVPVAVVEGAVEKAAVRAANKGKKQSHQTLLFDHSSQPKVNYYWNKIGFR